MAQGPSEETWAVRCRHKVLASCTGPRHLQSFVGGNVVEWRAGLPQTLEGDL
jgi:hypothetical protein